jgi:uncharacterized protein (TIRG00374 family)
MKTFIKAFVSLGLIGALLYNVDWGTLLANLGSLSIWAVIIVLLVFTVQFPISAQKWRTALRIHQLEYPFPYLLKVLCIGFFFNNFLPSSIGGDAYRVIKTMPKEGFKSRAISAVLLERIIGFGALLFLGFIGGLLTLQHEQNHLVLVYVLLCAAGGVVATVLYAFIKMGFFTSLLERANKIKKLEVLTHNLGHIWRNPGLVINISFVSLIFQVLAVVAISVLFDALGADGTYAKYALMAAVVGLAGVLPISINGIGVIEGAFVVSATQLGIGYNEAIIVAFMLRILVLPLSLICGLVYMLDTQNK